MNDLQHFRVETNSNGVTEVILCQPKKLNSMTPLFFEECEKVFKFLDKDDKTNVILIWAEGKMFTAGLDLKSASSLFTKNYGSQATTASIFREAVTKWQNAFTAIAKNKKPVIVAIHNFCIGLLFFFKV
jgi:enoyl-CoA hydratase/carnithine racemase